MDSAKQIVEIFPKSFLFIYLSLGLVWAKSWYEKISSGKFIDNLGMILTKFASHNPHGWYKDFLETMVIPHAKTYRLLVMWGEFLTALAILIGVIYFFIRPETNKLIETVFLLGILGALFLNVNFYFACGWMSPSTEALNLLMIALEIIGIVTVGKQILQ